MIWFLQRILQAFLVLFAISVVVFVGLNAIGNPIDIYLAEDATQQERQALIQAMGLDLPLWQQYLQFVQGLLHGQLHTSYEGNLDPLQLILQKLPATIELALVALLFAVVIGVPFGLIAGMYPRHWFSKTISTFSILGFSVPTFAIGILLIIIFSVHLGWFPSSARGETAELFGIEWSFLTFNGWHHLFLPALTLALFKTSLVIRLTRSGVEEVIEQDYIRFARAKGLSGVRITFVHILSATLIPLITVLGIELGTTIAYTVVTEKIFAWPGTGTLILESILKLNRPIVAVYLLLVASMFVMMNLVLDIAYRWLDPRVRLGGKL